MTLSHQSLNEKLAPRAWRFYEHVQSTQDVALDWVRQNAPIGAVVIADEQIGGRGRLNRIWHTPSGSAIALSYVLRPNIEQVKQVTMLGAVAVADTIENLGIQQVAIKWPNDIQINGRKVSGVLPEAIWDGSSLIGVALGIGINIRVNLKDAGLEQIAVNLEDCLGQHIDRAEFIQQLLIRLDYWLTYLGSEKLFTVWKLRMATLGKQVKVSGIAGIAEDVDGEGALLVRDATGVLHRVLAGDVISGE